MQKRVRASIVCVYDNKLLVFKGIDPVSGRSYWFLPGGKIEAEESPWKCCEREALEETGYKLHALPETEIIKDYLHEWAGEDYSCKTYFYKGVLAEGWHEPKPVADTDYNKGASWLKLDLALIEFSYCPEIHDAVKDLAR